MTLLSRSSLTSPIEVLLVSSDTAFVGWLSSQFQAADDLSITQVDSIDGAFVDGALAGDLDAVVCDTSIADSDVITFLQLVRAQRPLLPFVFLAEETDSGPLGDMMSAGLTESLSRTPRPEIVEQLRAVLEASAVSYRHRRQFERSESRARGVLNAAPDGMFVVRDGLIEFANDRIAEMLSYHSPEQLRDCAIDGVVQFSGESSTEALLAEAIDGPVVHRAGELRRRDDTLLAASVSAIRFEWDGTPATLLILRDDTDGWGISEELYRKNEAMDHAPVGITIAEPTTDEGDNPLVYVNSAFERQTGYTEAEALGRDCHFLQGPETDSETVAEIRRAIDERTPVTVEILNYRKDGTPFWNRLTIASIEMDTEVYYVGFQEDITDRVDDRQELRRFQRATKAARQGFFITDPDGTITHVNPAFEEITGYDKQDVIGRTPAILKSGQQGEKYYQQLWETILDGETWDAEIIDERSNGEFYYAHQTISPLLDDDGEVEEFVALQTDITERRERERQLKTFDRVLRHNLRNELTVIKGHAELIQSTSQGPALDSSEKILETTERLLNAANKGRRISELLAKPVQVERIDLTEHLTRVVSSARSEYPHAEITVDLSESSVVEATTSIDKALFELIENAVIHSENPSPTVDVAVTFEDDVVAVHVVDDGPGLPEVERAVLTDMQLEEEDLFHGSGLGLWFVYWVVQRSRGVIKIEENATTGSHVTVELPRPTPASGVSD